MISYFSCCSALKPRYKRLVDSIFPTNPQDGLVKNNMEKLIFYSLSLPEKLDRIGEYLYETVARDIYRRRYGFALLSMEAMDQLLLACHSQSLNLFVISYLKMIQKLLKTQDAKLQVLATQSFVRFANIEEDTPSYHRRYDFFISKFSSMCHNIDPDVETRTQIRIAGVRGLQAVFRKTISDDLVEDIWDPIHMNKILPSLLFNMQQKFRSESGSLTQNEGLKSSRIVVDKAGPTVVTIPLKTLSSSPSLSTSSLLHTNASDKKRPSEASSSKDNNGDANDDENNDNDEPDDPAHLAELCLRELVSKASFGHITSFLEPVLQHFETHNLWQPNHFAIIVFRNIMLSIQTHYAYFVIENLIKHLDRPNVQLGIADILARTIAISAEQCIGPSVMEITNSLFGHLQTSVLSENKNQGQSSVAGKSGKDGRVFQEALINALAEFTNHLPNYQKIEIMRFIASKIPNPLSNVHGETGSPDTRLQNILLKCLLKVSAQYTTVSLSNTFQDLFLETLLQMALTHDSAMRLLVQQILHRLLDRNGNSDRLRKPLVDYANLNLTIKDASRSDLIFMKKNGAAIFETIMKSLQFESNSVANVESVFTTLALIAVEVYSTDIATELIEICFALQNVAANQKSSLVISQSFHLNILAVSIFLFVSEIFRIETLICYAKKIIEKRSLEAVHLLPELRAEYDSQCTNIENLSHLLLDMIVVVELLKESGFDVSKFERNVTNLSITEAQEKLNSLRKLQKQLSDGAASGVPVSIVSTTQSFSSDWDNQSNCSSPLMQKKPHNEQNKCELANDIDCLGFDTLKRILSEPSHFSERFCGKRKSSTVSEQRRLVNEMFRTHDLDQLVKLTRPVQDDLQSKLSEILESLEYCHGRKFQILPSSPSSIVYNHHPQLEIKMIESEYVNEKPLYEKYFPELFGH